MKTRRPRIVAAALFASLSLALGGVAIASHSPRGDQTPGRHSLWTDRPGFGTNNPPLGESTVFIVGHDAVTDFVGNPSAQIRWVDRGLVNGVQTIDVAGEAIFDSATDRFISVFYNNLDCSIGADRSGHLAHVEWVPAHPEFGVSGVFRKVGGEGLEGYRIHIPATSIQSISVRRFLPGADFPETDANTELLACYAFGVGNRKV